jgi:hypothetical protein
MRLAAALDEGDRLARIDAGLLGFGARIHLHEKLRRAALFLHFGGKCGGDLLAIDRLDRVEQRHRFLRLVRLQRADQVEVDARLFGLEAGPFRLRLLHPVLAEYALAGLDDRTDVIGRKGL